MYRGAAPLLKKDLKESPMHKFALAAGLACLLPATVFAADGDWKGTGEVGLAASRGNAKSENVNAKLNFSMEDDTWKDNFYATALRNKAENKTIVIDANGVPISQSAYTTTANRYELGASAGYKFDERSYLVGALRY